MRHGSTLALVASSWLVIVAAPVWAQAPNGAGADAGAAQPQAWILPGESQGHRVAPILLLSRPEVQAELHMKPEQVADAHRVIADMRHKGESLRSRKNDPATIEQRKAVDEEQRIWLETKLTEDQVGRLSEVDLQWQGIAAIATRPGLAEALSLSGDQKVAVERAVAERDAHHRKPLDRERDPATVERHFALQIRSILNDGQRKRWDKMLGRPFAAVASAPGNAVR